MPVNKNPTVKEIVKEYLEKSGYDGLYREGWTCACPIENLMDCTRTFHDDYRAGRTYVSKLGELRIGSEVDCIQGK